MFKFLHIVFSTMIFVTLMMIHNSSAQKETAEFPWPNFRLPQNFRPLHYSLFIHPRPENDTLSGLVTLDLMVTQWSEWVVLNAYQLNVSRVVVVVQSEQQGGGEWDNVDHVTSDQWQMMAVRVPPAATISNGSRLRLTIHYRARMYNEDRFGFYKSYYYAGSDGKTKKPMYLAHFVPAYARRMLPCFDEPGFKANFTVSVVRPVKMISLSNMPLERTENFTATEEDHSAAQFEVDHFQTSVKMSTFLLTIVICDFASRSVVTKRGTKISVYAPEHLLNLTTVSLEAGVKSVEYLEEYFQIPYSLPKLDITMSYDFRNTGVENWGTIILDPEHYFLHNDSETWNFDKRRMKTWVVVHELVHQWIGNLVSVKYWSEIWLTEGVTEFVTEYVCDQMYPDWRMTKLLATGLRDMHMKSDTAVDTRPIRFYEENPKGLRGLFSSLAYYKGALLTGWIMDLLGEARFRTFLTDYLKRYSFDSVEEKDFFGVLNEHSPTYDGQYRLGDFVASFSDQPGHPSLNVEKLDGDAFLLKIHQTRFFNDKSLTNTTNQTWKIPLTFIDDTGKTQVFALVNSTQVIKVNSSSKWFKLNVNNAGYYRVNYQSENWHALFDHLIKNHTILSARDRYGLFSDIFSLVDHQKVDDHQKVEDHQKLEDHQKVEDYHGLNLTEIFKFLCAFASIEDDKLCFYLFFQELLKIGERLAGTTVFQDFQDFVKAIFPNVNNGLQYEWSIVASKQLKEWGIITAMNLMTYFDLGRARMTADRMVTQHLFGNDQNVLLKLEPFSLCTAALLYNESLWTPIFDMLYEKVEDHWEKEAYFACLLHSNHSDEIYRLMDSIENNTSIMYHVESEWYKTLRKAFTLNPNGMNLYWRYMKDHFDGHFNKLSDQRFVNFVYPLRFLNTEEKYDELKSFFDTKNLTEGRRKRINDILTTIHKNIESVYGISQALKDALE